MEWRRSVKPRSWQREALTAWCAKSRGIVKVVTGGGKTIFAEMAILEFFRKFPNGNVLIAVPSLSLLDQWVVGLKEDLQISEEDLGIVSSTERTEGQRKITVGVINSLRKVRNFPRPSMLVVDECHRVASEANQKIFRSTFDASLGLSATPERSHDDGLESILVPEIGPIIFNYDLAQGIKDGVICRFDGINVKVNFLEDEKKEYDDLTRKAARLFKKFEVTGQGEDGLKRILLKRARVCANATYREPFAIMLCEKHPDDRIILFHESVAAATRIFHSLKERGVPVGIYHSKVSPIIRRDNLRLFRRGIYKVLVCCRALDEGINVPEASVGIIASGTASSRQRVQRLGRVLRPALGKDRATVYTIYITNAERSRLEKEDAELKGLAKFSWMNGTTEGAKK